MSKIQILGEAYTTRSGSEDFETCVNWFPEKAGDHAKYDLVLYPTPGLTEYADLTGNQVRNMIEFDGFAYVVVDFKFYRVDQSGVALLKGSLNPVEPVQQPQIVVNGLQVGIVDNGYMYSYDIAADTFSEVTNPFTVAAAPSYITFQDGYGIYNQPGTSTWWITAINDFTMTSSLDFASANTTNQDIVAIVSNRQQLYIFTSVGCEIWYNSGNNDFPFERKNTSYITQGTTAPASIVTIDNTVFYLTRSYQGEGYVVRITGDSQPVVVSSLAINYIINQIDDISDAIGYSYQENGHLFYIITFPSGDKTFVYDLTTEGWHARSSTLENDPGAGFRQGRQRGNCYCFLGSRHIVGDFQSGKLYEMRDDTYTEDGAMIYRERTTSHLWNDLKRICLRSITIDCQMGVGTVAVPEPKLNLYVSKDGGYTYGAAHIGTFGAPGAYNNRIKFNQLGTARDFVGKITCTDPVNAVILGASAEMEPRSS